MRKKLLQKKTLSSVEPRSSAKEDQWAREAWSVAQGPETVVCRFRDGPLEKWWWGGGGGNFQLARIFFSLNACAGNFFQMNPSARIFFTTCEKVTIGLSFCMNFSFFTFSLCMIFFSWHFPLHEFFLFFFPTPPHHFSNGPSLRLWVNVPQHKHTSKSAKTTHPSKQNSWGKCSVS